MTPEMKFLSKRYTYLPITFLHLRSVIFYTDEHVTSVFTCLMKVGSQ